MSGPITEQDPFAPEEAAWLNQFLSRVSPAQALFLRGYLAGKSEGAAAPVAQKASEPLTILFGTESGNAEGLAGRALSLAKERGFQATVKGMDAYKTKDLSKEKNLLVIVSTWGEGDPPESAVDFYEFLHSDKAPKLPNVKYAVLSLGDSSYEHFCQTGKDFDKRFAELGATRAFDRVDSDVDFEEPFNRFMGQVWASFSAGDTTAVASAVAAAPVASAYDRKNPFSATILENINLNGRGSAKETRHLEIDLEGSGLTYEAGDALGVYPTNCPELVSLMIKAAKLKEEEAVPTPDGGEKPLAEALFADYDITTVSKPMLKKYLELGKNDKLAQLLAPESKDELSNYLWGRDLVDILQDFPVKDLDGKTLVSLLRKMPPRLYSIASSIHAHPDEVHLTVGAVRYQTGDRVRKGVCSTFLADRAAGEGKVPIYMHANKNFKLPQNGDTPIIMVGPGTGIAPFRAFIEERNALGAKGKNWLFFGDQHFATDFLYQTEWQDYIKTGVLQKIDLAFSRDTDEKVYVQHRMMAQSKDLFAWLEEGANFYVCGDASRMAKDVHEALISIVAKESGKGDEFAQAYVKDLQKQKRYQRDVY